MEHTLYNQRDGMGYYWCVPGVDATKSAPAFGYMDTSCASRNVQELHIIGRKQNRLLLVLDLAYVACHRPN